MGSHGAVSVVIGSSEHVPLAHEIAAMVNASYGRRRVSPAQVVSRLCCGDDAAPNRVLHLAFRDGKVVGAVSSTYRTPWTSAGCGHWGLLVVDIASQRSGVATALVAAAEERLTAGGCSHVQIEYHYVEEDAATVRLASWYEGRLGFERHNYYATGKIAGWLIGHKRRTDFRQSRKALRAGAAPVGGPTTAVWPVWPVVAVAAAGATAVVGVWSWT